MMNKKHKIAILQPEVPHYREEFFNQLKKECATVDVYAYNSFEDTKKAGFDINTTNITYISNKQIKGMLFYNPLKLQSRKYDTLVLMLHFAHITTWLLLLTKFIHRKRIILWGQGISVKRYLQEEIKPDRKLRWQIALADGVWIYMEKEAEQWRKLFPDKPIVALNNTLSGVREMTEYTFDKSKEELKRKYKITQDVIFIFCARFESNYRRTDLLVESIEKLDKNKYGFVIIGNGRNKPDFSTFHNVYDFGAVYDKSIKRELFSLADIYFQPGWVGLSIVEAMAYGKPIFTFRRSEETKQCVEYSYIQSGNNGMIFNSIDELTRYIMTTEKRAFTIMGNNARTFVRENLSVEQMVRNAISIL